MFLTDVREDHDRAAEMYERALAADPTHANNLGNYARLLFILGRDKDGEARAGEALGLATDPSELPLRAECSFYLFMHSPDRRHTSGGELKTLLSRGVSTAGWSFAGNLARVLREDGARAELLVAVASALAAGDDTGLDSFPEWQALPGT